METTLKYPVIHNRKQYDNYCDILEKLIFHTKKNKAVQDEIDLLTVLIEKYDTDNSPAVLLSPAELLQSFLEAPGAMSQKELVDQLDVSKGYVSDMVNGKKAISKEMAIQLARIFKVTPQAFYTSLYELHEHIAADTKATYRIRKKAKTKN